MIPMTEQVGCIFCGIVAGTVPGSVVFADEETLAFLDRAPANPGHTLVVPRQHATDLLDATPEQVAAIARTAQAVAKLQLERLSADGVTLFQANRPAGWQDVFHLHVHVVPRFDGDALRLPWKSEAATAADLSATLSRLTA